MAGNRPMLSADVQMPTPSMLDNYRRDTVHAIERAAVRTVDTISRRGKAAVRERFASAGLGRLGNAIDGRAETEVIRRGGDAFSVSAQFFIRSRSERTRGAIESYTAGSEIAPRRGRWLWVPTNNIPRVSKRERMTPALWRQNGFDKKIGPLFLIRSVNGHPLLVVENVGVAASGRKGSARSLTKKGEARKGQTRKELVVAFVGIPRTARAARVNITERLNAVRNEMPEIFAAEMAKEGR